MKKTLIAFLSITSLTFAQEVTEPEQPTATEEKKPQFVLDLESLTETESKEYGTAFFRADSLFKQKRIFECLEEIEKLHAIYDGNPASLNLQGACYVEFRSFDKARLAFAKAAKASPNNFNVKFNLAEIEFVSQNYAEALTLLNSLMADAAETAPDSSMLPILKFKILLCKLKTDDAEGAAKVIEDRNFLDDTPLFYYGKAALFYHSKEGSKAEEWLAKAGRIFRNQQLLAPWQDTLIEFGYIKSFYGGDLNVDGETPDATVE